MTKQSKWIVAALLGAQLSTGVARADDTADAIASLKKQIEALSAKVQALENRQQVLSQSQPQPQLQTPGTTPATGQASSSGTPTNAPAFLTAGEDGFWLRSANSNFTMRLGAVGQLDGHYYASPNIGSGSAKDTFTIRRLRAIASGSLYHDYDYYIQTDFGAGNSVTATNNSILQDAYLNIHYWPEFQVQGGKFKEPVGLEILPPDANLWFLERGFPTELVPNRNVGLEVHGDLWGGALSYAAGAFNGVPDGGSDDIETGANSKDLAARLFSLPFTNTDIAALKGFGLGVGASFGYEQGNSTPVFTTFGRQKFFSYLTGAGTAASPTVNEAGNHFRLDPQGYYNWGPAGLFWEYAISSQKYQAVGKSVTNAWFDNKGWDVSASWYLTGESNAFWTPPVPKHPFHINGGGLGAWQLTARLGGLSLDKSAFAKHDVTAGSAQNATSWGVGLNWYLNKNIKWMFEYDQTAFGFAPGTAAKALTLEAQPEKVFESRLQFSF